MTEIDSQPQPLPSLNYHALSEEKQRRFAGKLYFRRFLAGLFFGAAVWLVFWLVQFAWAQQEFGEIVPRAADNAFSAVGMVFGIVITGVFSFIIAFMRALLLGSVVVACQIIAALVCFFAEGWRGLGLGIFASIPVGALLMVGMLYSMHVFGLAILV